MLAEPGRRYKLAKVDTLTGAARNVCWYGTCGTAGCQVTFAVLQRPKTILCWQDTTVALHNESEWHQMSTLLPTTVLLSQKNGFGYMFTRPTHGQVKRLRHWDCSRMLTLAQRIPESSEEVSLWTDYRTRQLPNRTTLTHGTPIFLFCSGATAWLPVNYYFTRYIPYRASMIPWFWDFRRPLITAWKWHSI
jgi:hypothetical protein